MNLRQMEVFNAIMRAGSITAAAVQLNISQPAVSATLKHCESQLRMKLFFRVGGRLSPTPEGQALYPTIRAIFDRVDAANRLAGELATGRVGSITTASSPPLTAMLSYAVSTFLKDRPSIEFSILSLSAREMIDRVSRKELDLGLTYSLVSDAEVHSEQLVETELVCVMRSSHPLARLDRITFADLRGRPIITYAKDGLLRARIEQAASEQKVALDIRFQISSAMTGIMLTYFEAGLAIVEPTFLSQSRLPDLVARPFQPSMPLVIYMISPRRARLSHLTRTFLNHVKTSTAPDAMPRHFGGFGHDWRG